MQHRIIIPFSSCFQSAMLDGRKTLTTRYRPYGQVADCFTVFGATFVLESISSAYLHRVVKLAYDKEGFISPDEFINFWISLHPQRGYRPNDRVYVHRFFREI